MAQGATSAPFDTKHYEQVMGNDPEGGYSANCNLFWLDLGTQAGCPDAAIPLSLKQMRIMEQHYFKTPAPLKRELVVRVTEGFDVMANRGCAFFGLLFITYIANIIF